MICNGCQSKYIPPEKLDPEDNLWLCPSCNKKMKDPEDHTKSLKAFKLNWKKVKGKSNSKIVLDEADGQKEQ